MDIDKVIQKLISIQGYQQETPFSCGAAVVRTLLNYYGTLRNRSESEICHALGTRFEYPFPGTHPDNMMKFLGSETLTTEYGEHADTVLICHYVNQDIPVIILDSSWGGHWRMVIGHGRRTSFESDGGRDLYIADPALEASFQSPLGGRGVVGETEQQFYAQWFENVLYERKRDRFYIVAYPQG